MKYKSLCFYFLLGFILLLLGSALANDWSNTSFPVANAQAYTSPYGYRQLGGSVNFHRGLDIAAPLGSSVHSWTAGTIKRIRFDSACGNSILIVSGGWEHLYCHLEGSVINSVENSKILLNEQGELNAWEGQFVTTGQIIGQVGLTGRTTGPHLHWVLLHEGKYVNPTDVVNAMITAAQNSAVGGD